MKVQLVAAAAALCMIPTLGFAAPVQIPLDFADNGSAWTAEVVYLTPPLNFGLGGDVTNVGLASPDVGQYRLLRQVTAPAGFTFSNISLTAQGSGWSSWITMGRIGMDLDPETVPLLSDYAADASELPNGSINTNVNLSLDATGNPNYDGITSFYVSVEIARYYDTAALANIRNIIVSAELTPIPEPASLGLLSAGSLLLMRRVRRMK